MRHRILKLLSFIPDKAMVKMQYRIKFGRWPDLKNPKRFTEKIQLYKLYYRNPLMTVCSDKYTVRKYLEDKGLGHILPKSYGAFTNGNDIDFSKLPDRFVIKTNDGGGGNNIIICKDKSQLDIPETITKVNSWLNIKNINPGREWCYTGIPKSMILVEEYLENKEDPEGGIEDYKFYCFDGKPFVLQYDAARYTSHKRNFYDMDWNDIKVISGCPPVDHEVPKPDNFEDMKRLASSLSEGFPHVRVDFYSVNGKVYFGELTFYTAAGYCSFDPDSFDEALGREFDVSSFTT